MRVGIFISSLIVAVIGSAPLTAGAATAAETKGAGSTFVYPVMAKWSEQFKARTGQTVAYQSIGSALGISNIKSGAVDFGATDMPLKPEELEKYGLGQFPLVIGGVVPVFNIQGIKSGELRFSGELLANIFLGKIRRWDDEAIRRLNPDVKLPPLAISAVHRLDGSGTTFNFANYLSKVSAEWKSKVGDGTVVEWPVGLGGKGNDGVAALVEQINGAIGYVEYAYVLRSKLQKLSYGLLQNRAGKFIAPSMESFQAAAQTADWASSKQFYLVMTDAPGEQAYPITASTFMVMHKTARNPANAAIAMDFFKWALENGQSQAQSLHYVTLPSELVGQIESYWKNEFSKNQGL